MACREDLLRAAARIFARYGYRGSTTRRIADEAGVNEVTIFRRFGSKDALIHEAIASCGGSVPLPALPMVPTEPAAELVEWGMGLWEHLRANRDLVRRCMSEQTEHPEVGQCGHDVPRRLSMILGEYLMRLRTRGVGDGEYDPRVAATMFIGALFADAMGRDYMPDLFVLTPNDTIERYTQLLLRSIGAETPTSSLS